MSTGDHNPPTAIAAVSIKLPPFWDRNPATWFIQAEAQFHLSGITSQHTKFYHVISALSPTAAEEVYDIIATPPSDTPYDHLKNALLKRTTGSDRSRLRQLLSAEELGDRRPSQLLRRMTQLLGDSATSGDGFLRELFLQRLPQNVQMVLAAASNLSTEELAGLADAVIEIAAPASLNATTIQAQALDPSPRTQELSPHPSSIEGLAQQVNHLTQLVATLASRPRSPSPRRFRRRSPSAPSRRSRSRSPAANGVCWYHHRFGADARHCLRPCSWTGNAPADH